jgi:hypothetical protein
MSSHFSTIGLSVDSAECLAALARRVAVESRTETIRARGGRYLRWAGDSGEELWVQADKTGGLVGANPHFSCKFVVHVRPSPLRERLAHGVDYTAIRPGARFTIHEGDRTVGFGTVVARHLNTPVPTNLAGC